MLVSVPLNRRGLPHFILLPCHLLFGGQRSQWVSLPIQVQIFVQTIHQEVEEFFGILLTINSPLAIHTTTEIAERCWFDHVHIVFPQTTNNVCKDLGHDTRASLPIFLYVTLVCFFVHKELRERRRCGETLQCRIHVAGDAKVRETSSRSLPTLQV